MTFIEEGGTISPTTKEEVCCDSSILVGGKQVESFPLDVYDLPSSLNVSSPIAVETTQPASSFLGAPSDGEGVADSPINSQLTNGEASQSHQQDSTTTTTQSSGDEILEPPPDNITSQWAEGFDIKDPVELLFLLDDDIKGGIVQLHHWQAEFMLDFALDCHNKNEPYKAVVRACNGSGKDKYVVAASVVWLCMRYSMARGVVTNGSGVQLDNQTEKYIRYLCQRTNSIFAGGKELIWKCNYRYYECLPTQSPIVLFATDEPNKAEGYHPLKAGGKMAIFASEAKAIPDTIFTALTRCTGFTHRVDVSTPGPPIGYFHDICNTSISRQDIVTTEGQVGTIQYHITAFDCPHITANEIQQIEDALPGGKNNPVYKSAVLAEFSTTDEMVVIPATFVWWAHKEAPKKVQWIQEPYNKGGLDLADGGAETVLITRNGNKLLYVDPFKFDNSQDTVKHLESLFEQRDLTNSSAFIFGDCCGIGKPILDQLLRRGWRNLRYIDSRSSSSKPKVYLNRGTELFFHVRELLEKHELIFELKDEILFKQLAGRYYKINAKSIHQLLTKLEQRSKGYPSPDRADALNLGFCDYKSTTKYTDYSEAAPEEPFDPNKVEDKPIPHFSLKTWANDSTSNLEAFRRNVSKRQPTKYLQHELDRYVESRKL